jgi:hypothetical protein
VTYGNGVSMDKVLKFNSSEIFAFIYAIALSSIVAGITYSATRLYFIGSEIEAEVQSISNRYPGGGVMYDYQFVTVMNIEFIVPYPTKYERGQKVKILSSDKIMLA